MSGKKTNKYQYKAILAVQRYIYTCVVLFVVEKRKLAWASQLKGGQKQNCRKQIQGGTIKREDYSNKKRRILRHAHPEVYVKKQSKLHRIISGVDQYKAKRSVDDGQRAVQLEDEDWNGQMQ